MPKSISVSSFRRAVGDQPVVFIYELRSQPDESLMRRVPFVGIRNQGVLALSKKNDVILLNTPLDGGYVSWLDEVGFEHGRVQVIPGGADVLLTDAVRSLPKDVVSSLLPSEYALVPRIATADAHAVASYLDKPLFGPREDLMMRYYDKASFKEICVGLGLPVVPYAVVPSVDMHDERVIRDALSSIIGASRNAIVKQLTASAGAGSFFVDGGSLDDAVRALSTDDYAGGFLVERKVAINEEYSSQWVVDMYGCPHVIGVSHMHIGARNAHKGNSYSPGVIDDDVLMQSYELVSCMADEGYRGNTQIDLLRGVDGALYFSENNTRISGSSFAWELYDTLKCGDAGFLSSRFRTDAPCSFADLRERVSGLLYDGNDGLFPYDVGALPVNGTFFGLLVGDGQKDISSRLDALARKGIASDVIATGEGFR